MKFVAEGAYPSFGERVGPGRTRGGRIVVMPAPVEARNPLDCWADDLSPPSLCVKAAFAHIQYQSGTAYAVPGKYWDVLMDVAVDNGGHVTPTLVAPHGVPAVELRKMVSRGTLQAATRGVYRIPSLPYD